MTRRGADETLDPVTRDVGIDDATRGAERPDWDWQGERWVIGRR